MELIRRILLEIEANDQLEILDVSDDVIAHHVLLINEEQLLKGLVAAEQLNGPPILQQTMAYVRLTSKGHDFLNAIRDEGVWKKTKEKITEVGGGISLSLVTALATQYLKEKLGLP
jgi:hypothetical protein